MGVKELRLDKWMDALLTIDKLLLDGKNPNVTVISFSINCAYSHVHEIFGLLESRKFINTEKHGRRYEVTITPKGRDVAKNIRNIKKLLDLEE